MFLPQQQRCSSSSPARSSWALRGAVSPLPSYENCLPLHSSSSGLTRPLAAAARWPRAGLIPTAEPTGVTAVVHRRPGVPLPEPRCRIYAALRGESPDCDDPRTEVRHTQQPVRIVTGPDPHRNFAFVRPCRG